MENKDLYFLKEMKDLTTSLLYDKYDVTKVEQLDKMIDDWLDELEQSYDGWFSIYDIEHPIPRIGDIEIKFRNGTIINYDDKDWPFDEVTHWRRVII